MIRFKLGVILINGDVKEDSLIKSTKGKLKAAHAREVSSGQSWISQDVCDVTKQDARTEVVGDTSTVMLPMIAR